MPRCLRKLGEKIAVYDVTDPTNPDDAAMNTPLAYLSRVKFHSDFRYPAVVPGKIVTGTSTIPGQSGNTNYNGQINIYAHAMGDTPLVFGKITALAGGGANLTLISTPVSFAGSVPVAYVSSVVSPFGVFAHLGSSTTHVVLLYFGICPFGVTTSDITVTWEIMVLDTTINGVGFAANPAKPVFEKVGDRITMGRGKIDSERGYLRKNATSNQTRLISGETIVVVGSPNGSNYTLASNGWAWRFSDGNVALQANGGVSSSFAASATVMGL